MNNNILESPENIINISPILETEDYYIDSENNSPIPEPEEYYIDYENKKIKFVSKRNIIHDVFWCDFIETEYICDTCKTLLLKCCNCHFPTIDCYKCVQNELREYNRYNLLYCDICI